MSVFKIIWGHTFSSAFMPHFIKIIQIWKKEELDKKELWSLLQVAYAPPIASASLGRINWGKLWTQEVWASLPSGVIERAATEKGPRRTPQAFLQSSGRPQQNAENYQTFYGLLFFSPEWHDFVEMSCTTLRILRVDMRQFMYRTVLYDWVPNSDAIEG